VRRDDWLLAQLPVGMVEDDFFVRFVSIFQQVATTILDGVDNIDHVLDVSVAPDPMVRWLGSWIGADAVDASRPVDVQRLTVRTAATTLSWRGTRRGLQEFLELISGGEVELLDTGGVYVEGTAPATAPGVTIKVQSTGSLPESDFVSLVRDEVPAHVAMQLFVGPRCIYPPASFGPDSRAGVPMEVSS
jgi:phage tail-like protein